MSDIYKLQYNGMTLAYPGWNGYVSFEDAPKFKTLTLYASEGGTVTASVLTGMPGDTAQITTAYNTYYRFSGYDTAGGGSLNGDVYTFGDADADISAVYKVNYFTATGNFAFTARDVTQTTDASNTFSGYLRAKTGEMPSTWGNVGSVFKPSDASAYQMTIIDTVKVSGKSYHFNWTGQSRYDTTPITNVTKYTTGSNVTANIVLNGTTTQQAGVNIYMRCKPAGPSTGAHRGWVSMSPNGWTATGIAP